MVFNISIWDELYPKIVEEATIRDRDKQWYLIKQIDAGSETAKVVAQLDLDAWKGAMLVGYSNNSSTLQDTINGITPTGWTLIDSSGISIRRTIEGDYTPLEIVEQCRDTYGVYFRFDNVAQTVTVVVPDEAQPLGAFATRDLNLKEINYKGKSTTFATRLYAYGADGLSFASINGGLPYVDDHTYSEKVICAVWRDDRYTIAENLLEDAKKNLSAMAKPSRSYDCDVVDLAATNPELYSIQNFSIFRVATLIDDAKDFAINYQIVERWNYPYYPEKNKVIFSSSPAKIQNQLQQITHQVESSNSPFRQQQQAAINNATQWLTNGEGYVVVRKRADGSTQDILFMDTPDIATAADVLRIGQSGIGFSHSGVNGPYTSAWTIDGSFVADFITAGTLNANLIRAGILQDMKGWNFWDLETGEFRLAATATVNDQQIATKPETISGVDVEYASGTSQTTPPTSGWSTTAPAWQDGRYIWQRTVTTLADGTKSISEPTCIQGAKGPQGPAGKDGANGINGKDGTNGKDGASAYVHIKYAPVANPTDTQMTETPSEYIGICTNTTPTDPTTANSYQWSKWQGQDGAQGIPGTPGTNGQTTYVHFAYSTTADGTGNFSTTPFDDARYVGVCTDFKQADPTTPSSYQWSRMQGDGVSKIVEQYYLSTSATTQTGGSWSTAQPKWQKGRYIWTRSMVTWTDGTTTYTDPVLAQAINGANQSASDAQQSVDDLDNSLNSEGVFNRLTDNGKIQGIYMSGGQLYINGSYIKSGTLDASLVNVTNINANNIKSGTLDASLVNGLVNVTNINANNIASGKITSVDRRVVFDLDNNFIDVISSDGNYAARIANGMFVTMKKNGASFVQTGYLGSYSNVNASVVAVDWLDCSEGIVVTNGRRTGLYWEDITIDDGRKTKVLCGWNP